ncbi:helix-turn-helix domain-containing protein [Marinobacter sp. 1Y8]
MPAPATDKSLSRIEDALRFIHEHLDESLSVIALAARTGWSRWQFQRVFAAHTGLSVAQYVRELRLSRAAEQLLAGDDRQLDIALTCGFDSEISFSRSFRQMFGCTPGFYRRRGQRVSMRMPITFGELPLPPAELNPRMLQIRLESRPAFEVVGLCDQVNGLFSPAPDFSTKVPALWQRLLIRGGQPLASPLIGVLDVSQSMDSGASFPYWAALEADQLTAAERAGLHCLRVPAQQYAVIPFQGPIAALEKTLEWFIHHWLPASGYQGRYGFDLEIYPPETGGSRLHQSHTSMEYWVPVEPDPCWAAPLNLSV